MATSTIPAPSPKTIVVTLTAGQTVTITMEKTSALFFVTNGAHTSAKGGMGVFWCSDGGTLSVAYPLTSSGIGASTPSGQSVTLTNSSGYTASIQIIMMYGALPTVSVS